MCLAGRDECYRFVVVQYQTTFTQGAATVFTETTVGNVNITQDMVKGLLFFFILYAPGNSIVISWISKVERFPHHFAGNSSLYDSGLLFPSTTSPFFYLIMSDVFCTLSTLGNLTTLMEYILSMN